MGTGSREDNASKEKVMAKAKTLFTIGYEQTPSKAVLDELASAGVKLLVDVRAVTRTSQHSYSQ